MKYSIVFETSNGLWVPVEMDEWGSGRHLHAHSTLEEAVQEIAMLTGWRVIVPVEVIPP